MEEAFRLELQRYFDSFQNSLWRPFHEGPPSVLYHYSRPSGIRGILETQELWVSDVRHLNDTREGTYSLDVFGPILRRNSVPEWVKNDLFGRELHRIGVIWFHYVACFCATKDLDSQWNDYGESGTGWAPGN
jgi:hypothetical protein